MTKKESKILFQLIFEFIDRLSDKQYENLVSGNALIEYKLKQNGESYQQLKESLIQCKTINEIESILGRMLKKEIVSFCKYYKIDVKQKDTKKEMYDKIADHLKIQTQGDQLNEVKIKFQQMKSMEEAKQYLTSHQLLKTKKDIIRLAKLLDVYVNQKDRKDIILNRIIESVIGSQVRADVIIGR
jgi:N-glycosylase/DNA lyase